MGSEQHLGATYSGGLWDKGWGWVHNTCRGRIDYSDKVVQGTFLVRTGGTYLYPQLLRQKDCKFDISSGYMVNSRQALATTVWKSVSTEHNNNDKSWGWADGSVSEGACCHT